MKNYFFFLDRHEVEVMADLLRARNHQKCWCVVVFCAKQVEWDLLSHSSVKSAKRSQRPPPQVYSKMTALLPVICKTLLLWFMNHIHQFPHDTLLPLTQLHWIDSNESFGEVESFYLCQLYIKRSFHRHTEIQHSPADPDDTHFSHHTLQTAERTAAQDTVETCQTNHAKWAVRL